MKSKVFLIIFLFIYAFQSKAQVKNENFFEIAPQVGYDLPKYNNNLQFVDYEKGLRFGLSLDKFFGWYGIGLDADYIPNNTLNLYPESDFYVRDNGSNYYFDSPEITTNSVDRLFVGIGPDFKYQSKNNHFVAQLNTRAGFGRADKGEVQVKVPGFTNTTPNIILSEHGGYSGKMVFSYKGQARVNYYFKNGLGLTLGGSYLNQSKSTEKAASNGFVEEYYQFENSVSGNEILPQYKNERTTACDCNISSIGASVGISFVINHKKKSDKQIVDNPNCVHSPKCVGLCEPCCPIPCTICPGYAIRINVEDAYSRKRIDSAEIELVAEGGPIWTALSTDRGGKNFEDITGNNYTAVATYNGVSSKPITIDESELAAGKVVTKTLFIGRQPNDPEPEDDSNQNSSYSLTIVVTDQPTGLKLPNSEITLVDEFGKTYKTAITDKNGEVTFANIAGKYYSINGSVLGVSTTSDSVSAKDFQSQKNITVNLFYEDFRFILVGKTVDTQTRAEKGDILVSITNKQTGKVEQQTSNQDGDFNFRLERQSTYQLQANKTGEFSETESISTNDLSRSVTLFVELELGISEPQCNQTVTLPNISFDPDSDMITPKSERELDRVYDLLAKSPDMKIEIRSNTDSRGSRSDNQKLSQRRANSIKAYLVDKGISPVRIIASGYGEDNLINGCSDGVNCTEEEHAQNKRTEFKIICN